MIARIRGTVLSKYASEVVVEVQGIGYEIHVPMSTSFNLPELGNEVILLTHFVVREDAQTLYGFSTDAERELFRKLIKVSGVGAKMAITILSGSSVDGFVQSVQDNDVAGLTRLPGIGKKTAERLIVEMRDKLKGQITAGDQLPITGAGNAKAEAVTALVALGYKAAEAERMVNKIIKQDPDASSEVLIRAALRGTL